MTLTPCSDQRLWPPDRRGPGEAVLRASAHLRV